jgi:hypothetical protein
MEVEWRPSRRDTTGKLDTETSMSAATPQAQPSIMMASHGSTGYVMTISLLRPRDHRLHCDD